MGHAQSNKTPSPSQLHKHNLYHQQFHSFSMRPSNPSQNEPVSRRTPPPQKTSTLSSSTSTGKKSKSNSDFSSIDTSQSEGKEVTKKSTWSKIKQYGKTGIA